MLWMFNEVFPLRQNQIQTLLRPCCPMSCFPYSSWVPVLFTALIFLQSHGVPSWIQGDFHADFWSILFIYAFFLVLGLAYLALSASNGWLCVGSCFLCCGSGHGYTVKTRGLTWCIILVFHLSQESQSCAGSCPTSKHICFLYFVQICVYGRKAIPILVSQSQPEAEVSCLLILIFLFYFPQKHIIKTVFYSLLYILLSLFFFS